MCGDSDYCWDSIHSAKIQIIVGTVYSAEIQIIVGTVHSAKIQIIVGTVYSAEIQIIVRTVYQAWRDETTLRRLRPDNYEYMFMKTAAFLVLKG